MANTTVLLRTRVPKQRLRRAEKVLAQLGLKPGDAVNLLLAQIEIRNGVPFALTTTPPALLSADQQAAVWTDALGEY